ncbi:MAG: hypothetical protein ISS43_04730 [Candidatus Omnitrophica bacterium]|nr:hypothetical protein [Candidatus Omnitrophota bacterium]
MKKFLLKRSIFCLGFLASLTLFLIYSLNRVQASPQKETARKVKYTSYNLRDPFQSPFEMVEAETIEPTVIGADLPHLRVQGIVWGSKVPQAIINNTVVKVGEIIEGAEIIDIRKEGVYVLYEEGQYILRPSILK